MTPTLVTDDNNSRPNGTFEAALLVPLTATRQRPLRVNGLLAILMATLLAGCSSEGQSPAPPAANLPSEDAASALHRIIQHYQTAACYHDRGRLRLRYEIDGQERTEETQIDVDFVRPLQLHLVISLGINRLQMVSDGQHIWTTVEDPLTDNLRRQIVQRRVSSQLTVAEVYAATEVIDPAVPNQMQSILLGMPLDLHVSQLGLLLPNSALIQLLSGSSAIRFLAPAPLDEMTCRRIEAQTANGSYIFWLDPQTERICRIQYPTDALFEAMPVDQRPQSLTLTMDLLEASFDPGAMPRFAFEPAEDAPRVQYFVLPPAALPSELFGQPIQLMTFDDLEGQPLSNSDWEGKIQVLTWFDDHPASRVNLSQLEEVAARFAGHADQIVFQAICAVPTEQMDAGAARQLAQQWNVTLPLLRDPRAAGLDALNVTDAPTTVILDPARRLHLFEVGANPELHQSVNIVLQRLLSGENVAEDVRQNWQTRDAQFREQLQLALVAPSTQPPDTTANLSPASSFSKLRATTAWEIDDLSSPGNLELLPQAEAPSASLLILNDLREVVSVRVDGVIVARQTLDLPDEALVSHLRRAVDSRGRVFYLAFSQLGRHVFVFDENFRRVLQYPGDDQRHHGIMAADLLDLDADGQLEMYLGFAAPHGCQRVNLSGERTWSNRTMPAVISLAAQAATDSARLLVTGESGMLLPIRADGQHDEPITVGRRTIHQLVGTPNAEPRATDFLGMSYTIEGRLIAVGLDRGLEQQWAYGLPAGLFRHPVRTPVWSTLFQGSWLLAGPDGSVHLVRDDGGFFDSLQTGSEVLGLHGESVDGKERLYVVTPRKVTAYDLTRPSGTPSSRAAPGS